MADWTYSRELEMAGKKVSRNAQRLLTVRDVLAARDGDHADGGGLYLRVRATSASWLFRYTAKSSKRREMGLGAAIRLDAETAGKCLAQARKDADAARELLVAGKDPIDERAAAHRNERDRTIATKAAAKSQTLTLARASRSYHEKFIEPHRSDKHGAQWISSLENHIPEATWHRPIGEVTAGELLDVLLDLYATVPETAGRIRQRLDAVFDDAMLRGQAATNPAAMVRRKLTEVGRRKKVEHFRSLPYSDAPAFLEAVRGQDGTAALALQLLMLTASRTGEIIAASKAEFDVDAAVWRVPAARMKGGEDHTVYLSPPALAIVRELRADESNVSDYLFPSPTGSGEPISNMALLVLLRRMKVEKLTTAHGLRATFSTWANETNQAREDVIEACLAHREADKVRAAYNRAQFAADRRALLEKWAAYLTGIEASNTTTADALTAA